MRKLVLERLIIISQKNEIAKTIEFDERLTIITGENPDGVTVNRTGKSLVIKSIFHALGAKLSQYTSNWNDLQISTILSFKYNGKKYEIYRERNRFLLIEKGTLTYFKNISELRKFFVELFNFKIRMQINKNDDVVYAYPGAIFMPFYIDQDKGWSGSWDSFRDVFNAKWKQEILLYHMGVRTPRYYDLLDEKVELTHKQNEIKEEEKTLNTIIKKHVEKYKNFLDINVELKNFEHEISLLTNELNIQLKIRNEIKEEIVNCFNEIREYEDLYLVAERVYHELLNDIDYIEKNHTDESIECPTCGTKHENSILNRFHLYSEIEECESAMKQYFEEREKIEKRLQKQIDELKALEGYINKIESILNRKREAISFKEIVVAEGSKSILEDLKIELASVQNEMRIINLRLKEISKEQAAITKEGKYITDQYLEKFRNNINYLNVVDITDEELNRFKTTFSSGGNDLPSAILAQVFALYSISEQYSETVCPPIVLDAIFQQEPAEEKINLIWEFVLDKQPLNSQMVISTTEINNRKFNGKVIHLTKERGLLTKEDYLMQEEKILKYKHELLKYL